MQRTAVFLCICFMMASANLRAQTGPNMISDPGFEIGLFNLACPTSPNLVPTSGWCGYGSTSRILSTFARTGLFCGAIFGTFVTTGSSIFIESFNAIPGQTFQMSCWTRSDPLSPMQSNNFAFMQIDFVDAANVIMPSGVASTPILTSSSSTTAWNFNAPITATAPAGTVSVRAEIIFVQPCAAGICAGGAGLIDDVSFNLVVPPLYPGTGGDPVLRTGINGAAVDGVAIKTMNVGDVLEVNVSSPNGCLALRPYYLFAQAFPTPVGPGTVSGLPIYFDINQPIFVLVNGAVGGPFFGNLIGPGNGTSTFYAYAGGFAGQSVMFQALTTLPPAAFCPPQTLPVSISDGHAIQL